VREFQPGAVKQVAVQDKNNRETLAVNKMDRNNVDLCEQLNGKSSTEGEKQSQNVGSAK